MEPKLPAEDVLPRRWRGKASVSDMVPPGFCHFRGPSLRTVTAVLDVQKTFLHCSKFHLNGFFSFEIVKIPPQRRDSDIMDSVMR